MRRKPLIVALIIAAATILLLLLLPSTSGWLAYRDFQWTARRKMDASTLQTWATRLLQEHPPAKGFYLDLRGTNLPPGMAEIKGYQRSVSIVVGEEKLPRVVLFGALGEPAILAGPPSFVCTNAGTSLWEPGIYFQEPGARPR